MSDYQVVCKYLESIKPPEHDPTKEEVTEALCNIVISNSERIQKLEDQIQWVFAQINKIYHYDE